MVERKKVTRLTIENVLEKAIRKEIESQLLYSSLSQRMADPAAKEVLEKLQKQEKRHQTFLEQYRRGELGEGMLGQGWAIDYKLAESLDQPQVNLNMGLPDIFLMAANREKASHELYLGLAAIHPEGKVRRLLEELAAQELEHKRKVEFLYTEVAFPQTDGG